MPLTFEQPPQNITSPQHFGPYAVRLTDSNDVDAVVEHIQSKEKGETESKRNAVYLRDRKLVEQQVSNGFFVVLERLAANDRERELLHGADRAIVAGTGAYPLGIDETGRQIRIPNQARNGTVHPALITFEVGSSLYVKANDLPNENGLRPRGCTYDLIVGLTTFNLFGLAEKHGIEAITANVQTQLDDVIERLTGEFLGWRILPKPSPELKNGSFVTTADKSGGGQDTNFKIDKLFFHATPDKLPNMANFLDKAIYAGSVTYDRGGVTNTLNVDCSGLPDDLKSLIRYTASNPSLFHADERAPDAVKQQYANRTFFEVCQNVRTYMRRDVHYAAREATEHAAVAQHHRDFTSQGNNAFRPRARTANRPSLILNTPRNAQ